MGRLGRECEGTRTHTLFNSQLFQRQPCLETYAAVGAAAILGGVRRRLLSVAVIVMETTGSMTAKSPIILATFFAKMVGDLLTIGVYDYTVRRLAFPYLESQPRELPSLKIQV